MKQKEIKPRRFVFTLQSIKSRIETAESDLPAFIYNPFLLYSPLNQGLKQAQEYLEEQVKQVFTLQSIKSRIETIGV